MTGKTYVFGDIHGSLAPLEAILDKISLTLNDQIIFLGDLIDRGPDSAGVIDCVLKLSQTNHVKVIMGNHEQMMLMARESQDAYSDWIESGGDATLKSYAGARATMRDVPREHWEFLLKDLVPYVETRTHIFVHANAEPGERMEDQPDYMLRWERCDRIEAHDSGKVIICGHTPQKSGRPMNRGYAICLDTDAARGGPLTCLEIKSGVVWQAKADRRVMRSHISDDEE